MITGILENRYTYDGAHTLLPQSKASGHVGWECPSNIALIKYWGKKSSQLPANPSLSFTLALCTTKLSIDYEFNRKHNLSVDFRFGDDRASHFHERLVRYLQSVSQYMPFLRNSKLWINASNTFPHSAGIASSASSYAALALSLCTLEEQLTGIQFEEAFFYNKASFLARLGSGSASRSVYGGAVLWGQTPEFNDSTDEAAIPISGEINPDLMHLRDSILVVSPAAKKVSSSAGHKLMDHHPFHDSRIVQANFNLSRLLYAMKTGNMVDLIEVIENEALSLHALIISSSPSFMLLKPNTIEIISSVWDYRQQTGLPVGFTMDAGPNVHLLYPSSIEGTVRTFIDEKLKQFCESEQVIHDHVGNGPVKLA